MIDGLEIDRTNPVVQTVIDDIAGPESAAMALAVLFDLLIQRPALVAEHCHGKDNSVCHQFSALDREDYREGRKAKSQARVKQLLGGATPTPNDDPETMFSAACQLPLSEFDSSLPLCALVVPLTEMIEAIITRRLDRVDYTPGVEE